MQDESRKEKITKELTPLPTPRTGYEPVKEGQQIGIALTNEQLEFIDQVARQYNLQFWAAFEMVWNDGFNMLTQSAKLQSTYTKLPMFNKTKVIG